MKACKKREKLGCPECDLSEEYFSGYCTIIDIFLTLIIFRYCNCWNWFATISFCDTMIKRSGMLSKTGSAQVLHILIYFKVRMNILVMNIKLHYKGPREFSWKLEKGFLETLQRWSVNTRVQEMWLLACPECDVWEHADLLWVRFIRRTWFK